MPEFKPRVIATYGKIEPGVRVEVSGYRNKEGKRVHGEVLNRDGDAVTVQMDDGEIKTTATKDMLILQVITVQEQEQRWIEQEAASRVAQEREEKIAAEKLRQRLSRLPREKLPQQQGLEAHQQRLEARQRYSSEGSSVEGTLHPAFSTRVSDLLGKSSVLTPSMLSKVRKQVSVEFEPKVAPSYVNVKKLAYPRYGRGINSALRSGIMSGNYAGYIEETLAVIKPFEEGQVVYRGMTDDTSDIEYEVGKTINIDGFLSCSRSPTIALMFASEVDEGISVTFGDRPVSGATFMEIDVPGDAWGATFSNADLPVDIRANETVISTGQQFEVVSIQEVSYKVKGEFIPIRYITGRIRPGNDTAGAI